MNADEFFKMCDIASDNTDLAVRQKNMSVFGNVENIESGISSTPANDFSDDFSGDEPTTGPTVTQADDFTDDFMDDFVSGPVNLTHVNALQEESSHNEEELNSYGIKSISITPSHTETESDKEYNICAEIIDFMEQHGASCSGTDNIIKLWNALYNDCLESENSVIEKYLRVHYGLWFDKQQTMNAALSYGREFIQQLKFNYRMCVLQDIRFISSVWKEDYYDSSVVNEFAVSTEILPKLLELMSKRKADTEILAQYRNAQDVLLCCIRLMIEDKFIPGEFNKAVADGNVLNYTESMLAGNISKLDCIRHRSDFSSVNSAISSIESGGGIVRPEILEEFADAFYLEEIIFADAEGRLNKEFAHNYLMNDLKSFSFIAEYYRNGLVAVESCPDNFMYAKILTDINEFGLDGKNFQGLKSSRGIQCLVCSVAASCLSNLDYKKFLAVISVDESGDVIADLDKSEKLLTGYNTFWFQTLADRLNLKCEIPQDVGDNILYVRILDGKKRKYYLQLDDYVLNRERFLALIQDSRVIMPFDDSSGMMLCNEFVLSSIKFTLKSDSSVTTWAKGRVDQKISDQFSEYSIITHANFLKALEAADVKVSVENKEKNRDVRIHSSALEFLKMDFDEYYRYDKMFGYISEHAEFLGLFTSVYAFTLLKLFSSACTYDSVPKAMFMFLYIVFFKFHKDKFQIMPNGFKELDPDKSVLIVDGTKIGGTCMNYRTIISSIDNFIDIGDNFNRVVLSVSEKTIFLKLK